jgi:predicted NBD/HSP70 family sugar kinase
MYLLYKQTKLNKLGGYFFVNKEIRYENTFKTVKILMEKKISRVDLAKATGLTTAGIGKIVKNLIDLGIVKEKERISRNVGKPPTILEIVPESIHVVGIGIGRDRVESCLTDAKGKILDHVSSSFDNLESLVNTLYENVDSIFRNAKRNSLEIKAIGVGIPGIVNKRKGYSEKTTKFGNFENILLNKILKDRYKVEVYVENDADMAAIGEKWFGGGIHLNNLIYFLIDSGIGAGIVINGSIYQGEMGYAGEIGHSLVIKDRQINYFEDVYGLDVILKSAQKFYPDLKSVQDFNKIIAKRDDQALKIFGDFAREIASLVLSVSNVTGIQNVFIGGKSVEFGNSLLQSIIEITDNFSFPNHKLNVQFSHLGDISIPLGSATQAIVMHVRKIITTS